MSLCESIDTLAMAYLDDELAAEERHELEAHLTECASCRTHVDGERADLDLLRKALAAPAAPDLLRAKVARALDAEDRTQRRRWASYLLPGSAMVAAAAAIAVFVAVKPPGAPHVSPVARDAVRQQSRQLPLEVQGPGTTPWLRQNFAAFEPPQVETPGTSLLGARLLPQGVNGHDAALMSYRMTLDGNDFVMSVLAVKDLRDEEMQDGDEVRICGRTLHVVEQDGKTAITYVDSAHHLGYMFMAPALDVNELIWLVGKTDLVGPQ